MLLKFGKIWETELTIQAKRGNFGKQNWQSKLIGEKLGNRIENLSLKGKIWETDLTIFIKWMGKDGNNFVYYLLYIAFSGHNLGAGCWVTPSTQVVPKITP